MKRIFYILLILFSYATPSFSEITEVYGNFLNPSERKCLKIILNEPKTDPDNEYTSVYDPEQEPSIADIYIKDKKIFSVMGEYLYYAGLCFDQHTKLHNLIFKIPKIYENELVDIIYVHYEKESNSFSKTILDYQFDDYSQLDETVKTKAQPTCSWRAILDAKNKARKVKNQILPSEKVSNFKKEIKKIKSMLDLP
ncbi:MAG: hypothetical protein OMM_03374 [Candidatus Magnetoglobus multicellularis str. Araruama]|uniref:Uncharacterized protein n=1 Tax=Candidatus Magnetoglobus multicellularis str. Araruama TaxID=890399 RepID=A0A1V1P5S8_9BACT|nr:MAG: hypothetical protein OMM_03374 [Candidatus Magnetoglobus multicellularis str. Araruama]